MREKFNKFVQKWGNFCCRRLGDYLTEKVKPWELLATTVGVLALASLSAALKPEPLEATNRRLWGLDVEILKIAELSDGRPGLSFQDQAELAAKIGYKGIITEGCSQVSLYHNPNSGRLILNVNDNEIVIPESKAREYIESGGK